MQLNHTSHPKSNSKPYVNFATSESSVIMYLTRYTIVRLKFIAFKTKISKQIKFCSLQNELIHKIIDPTSQCLAPFRTSQVLNIDIIYIGRFAFHHNHLPTGGTTAKLCFYMYNILNDLQIFTCLFDLTVARVLHNTFSQNSSNGLGLQLAIWFVFWIYLFSSYL